MKKESNLGAVLWVIVIVILLVLVFAGFSASNNTSQISMVSGASAPAGSVLTVYPIQCKEWDTNPPTQKSFEACNSPVALSRDSFKVDVANQKVTDVSLDDGEINNFPSCNVIDSTHWNCSGESGTLYTEFSMTGQVYHYWAAQDIFLASQDQWVSLKGE